jgi:hypothetical protein
VGEEPEVKVALAYRLCVHELVTSCVQEVGNSAKLSLLDLKSTDVSNAPSLLRWHHDTE